MQFLRQTAEEGLKTLVAALIEPLQQQQTVLWLVPGGSNIKVAVAAMAQLKGYENKLSITLTDERYGHVGHPDSNWQQLLDAGFDSGQAKLYPVLRPDLDLQQTAEAFGRTLQDLFTQTDVIIGQFGIGADGHISGILPHSRAAIETADYAFGYVTPSFKRVTTTFSAIKKTTQAFCFVYGEDKQAALTALRDQQLPLEDQPAQILK